MSDKHIQESHGGLEFYDDEGVHRVMLKRTNDLSSDVYVNLPSESGTLATQEYVAENGGGEGTSPLRVFVLDTVVDITNNDEFVDVLSASVEASSTYYVEGYIRGIDAVDVDLILSYPSGAEWSGVYHRVNLMTGAVVAFWDGTRLTATDFGKDNVGIKFSGVLTVASTAGNFKLRACQTVADPTTTEIPVGTYITITKAQ